MADNGADVVLTLTHDEALVLSDWLNREGVREALRATVLDEAELIAIDALTSVLEPELVEPLQRNYAELVEAARGRLRPPLDG